MESHDKSQEQMTPPPASTPSQQEQEQKAQEETQKSQPSQEPEPQPETPRADVPMPPQLDKEAEQQTKEGLQKAIDRHADVPKAPPKPQQGFTPGGEIITDPISDPEAKEKLRQQVAQRGAGDDEKTEEQKKADEQKKAEEEGSY